MTTSAGQLAAACVALVCGLGLLGCGARAKTEPGPRGTVRFDVIPKEAALEVDEQRLGPAQMFREHGILLKPGQHRVILRHPGYFPEYRLVEVVEDRVILVKIRLRPIPP